MSRHLRVARVPSSEILPAQLAGRGTVSVRGLVSIRSGALGVQRCGTGCAATGELPPPNRDRRGPGAGVVHNVGPVWRTTGVDRPK